MLVSKIVISGYMSHESLFMLLKAYYKHQGTLPGGLKVTFAFTLLRKQTHFLPTKFILEFSAETAVSLVERNTVTFEQMLYQKCVCFCYLVKAQGAFCNEESYAFHGVTAAFKLFELARTI